MVDLLNKSLVGKFLVHEAHGERGSHWAYLYVGFLQLTE